MAYGRTHEMPGRLRGGYKSFNGRAKARPFSFHQNHFQPLKTQTP